MSIKSRITSAAQKTSQFLHDNGDHIFTGAILLTSGALYFAVTTLIKRDEEREEQLTTLQAFAMENALHPRYVEKNEDGSFTVTRLSKNKEDQPTDPE